LHLPPLSLVLGGISSGKSAFAERMVRQCGLAKVYVATAEARTGVQAEQISAHRARRSGQGWRTVEAPYDTAMALSQVEPGEVALLDSVTLWLTTLMIDDGDWKEELDILIEVLLQLRSPVVLVSDDVASTPVPEDALSQAFQRAQGAVNQRLASHADLVVYLTAGLPHVLQGRPDLDAVDAPW